VDEIRLPRRSWSQRKGGTVATTLTHTASQFEELDYREADGLEVSLLWNRHDGSLSVYVVDSHSNTSFELAAPSDRARDVFLHPFAYA
jgi:hypothetical protein